MLGGYISDLEAGDVFEPVEYVLTPYMASEYAHGFRRAGRPRRCKARPSRSWDTAIVIVSVEPLDDGDYEGASGA